ncbi:MAG: hydantoinase B/oxoprolinase family protein [Saprospiraceae bacterium]|nr:hydantoinase B/oxoprolinase family protein [Saprospiraceae bacterium]
MKTNAKTWKIFVDTGGTFTDCMGIGPSGKWLRTKVLSSGILRATLTKQLGSNQYSFQHNWNHTAAIFQGYNLRFPLHPKSGVFQILELDPQTGLIKLDRPARFPMPSTIEIYADEEAPILGARILTQTPLNKLLPATEFRLGTTRGTNALLEHKGAKTLLLTSRGFKDLLLIGNQQRPDLFQLDIPPRARFQSDVLEVEERLDVTGFPIIPLEETEIRRILAYCQKTQPEAIAVCLIHSYLQPEHENRIAHALRAAGFQTVCASNELLTTIGFLARTQTCVLNAYLLPVLSGYLDRIQSKLPNSSLQLMTSSGGLWPREAFRPVESLLSGPAGGVVGAKNIAQNLGFDRLLCFDMGGTSTDTAHYNGHFDYHYQSEAAGWELLVPALGIETVAAGGGSICYLKNGRLQVGPESAGAYPGPACYGAGGPLTITDVNVLLGKMAPDKLSIPINTEAALNALDQLLLELNKQSRKAYSQQGVLEGLIRIANEKMAEAIRRISVSAGFDPSEYPLLAFGGAGGLHACKLAEQLRISKVILPKDGGLLSAYGIGQAQIERWAERQILQPFTDCQDRFREWFLKLEQEAFSAVQNSIDTDLSPQIQRRSIFLRFRGQSESLETPWSEEQDVLQLFYEKYKQQYGHVPNHPVEVDLIRLLASGPTRIISADQHTGKKTVHFHFLQPTVAELPPVRVYDWDELPAGVKLNGPLILTNPFSTAYVESGWSLELTSSGDALLTSIKKNKLNDPDGEAIQLELFTNRFTAIAREMGVMLQRSAFSVNIRDRLDFSCGLLDPAGNLLVNAPHIPVHLGSLGLCARLSLEACPLQAGEILITNHPKFGGSHLPDVTLLAPVFTEEQKLIGYVINRAHHAEIGGLTPGSMPTNARSLMEEGVVIPPTKIARNGQVDWPLVEAIFQNARYPSRAVTENLADIRAALAALQSGQKKLQSMVNQFGLESVQLYMTAIRRQAKNALESALEKRGNGVWNALEKLDDGHRISLKIEIKNKRILFDFDGTSGVHPGNLNANRSIVYSAILYVLRLLCRDQIPLNEGLLEPVEIRLPLSFLNPHFPDNPADCPAVVGGNTEVSQRLVDTLLLPFDLVACGHGSMNNFLFGNAHYGYYETIGGGSGAGPGFAGRDAVHQHMTNTRITDPEILEKRFPVRLREFSIRKNSGGTGRWPGGNGIIREIEFLEPVVFTLISQHRREQPYGKAGGNPGVTGRQFLIEADGKKTLLNGTDSRKLQAGDRIRIETPGGGAWGNPD